MIITLFAVLSLHSQGADLKELLNRRDPFRPPSEILATTPLVGQKSETQFYGSSDYRLIGVMTGPNRVKALVESPSGKTFFVTTNDPLGAAGGRVVQINENSMVIEERVTNPMGNSEKVKRTINLVQEGHSSNSKGETKP